jgi:hypothetical protein
MALFISGRCNAKAALHRQHLPMASPQPSTLECRIFWIAGSRVPFKPAAFNAKENSMFSIIHKTAAANPCCCPTQFATADVSCVVVRHIVPI